MEYPILFTKCIKVVLDNEGGYVWHPNDPGGETNMGIAKLFYPNLDIKNLTKEQAINIYFRDYWKNMHLDKIHNDDLVLQVFDFGINAGTKRSIKILQGMVGVDVDGVIGPVTSYFVNYYSGNTVEEFKEKRREYYRSLVDRRPSMKVFLNGWLHRVNNTKF
jgi:lysozyme family protein